MLHLGISRLIAKKCFGFASVLLEGNTEIKNSKYAITNAVISKMQLIKNFISNFSDQPKQKKH